MNAIQFTIIIILVLIPYLPLVIYLSKGSTIVKKLKTGELESVQGLGSTYAQFLLESTDRNQAIVESIMLSLPFFLIWSYTLVIDFSVIIQTVVILLPFLVMAIARPFINRHPQIISDFGNETFTQILESDRPLELALSLIRLYENSRVGERYLQIKKDLLLRNDEIGLIFQEAYHLFEDNEISELK